MRTGCDGSRETLLIRKLIGNEQLNCIRCGVTESRRHILEDCEIYGRHRMKLVRGIERTREFQETTQGMNLTEICLYQSAFQRKMKKLTKD